MKMWEYSMRFLIAMIIGVCVLLLFITGKSGQSSVEILDRSSVEEVQKVF
jgi:hypothetical protein